MTAPALWKRWELDKRPLLYKDDYGTDDFVIEDIKNAKFLSEKFISEEEMFQPRQVASCLVSLLLRLISVRLGWTPLLEKVKLPVAEYYILKLDEKERKWSLIFWDADKSNKFSSMNLSVKPDPDNRIYAGVLGSYEVINEHFYGKLKEFEDKFLAQRKK